jgi:hypothetical protein
MACTTVYIHISLLTSKGLAQQGAWQRRMAEKEVRNEWSQYSPRTVTGTGYQHHHCDTVGLSLSLSESSLTRQGMGGKGSRR